MFAALPGCGCYILCDDWTPCTPTYSYGDLPCCDENAVRATVERNSYCVPSMCQGVAYPQSPPLCGKGHNMASTTTCSCTAAGWDCCPEPAYDPCTVFFAFGGTCGNETNECCPDFAVPNDLAEPADLLQPVDGGAD